MSGKPVVVALDEQATQSISLSPWAVLARSVLVAEGIGDGAELNLTFIDIEGVAGLMAAYTASAADLCIVPMRASALDGDAAGAALKLIASAEKQTQRKIPAYILLAQTEAAVKSRSYFEILREFHEGGVQRFEEELNRRAAFERIVAEGRTLFELEPSKAVTSAVANAARLGTELADILEA